MLSCCISCTTLTVNLYLTVIIWYNWNNPSIPWSKNLIHFHQPENSRFPNGREWFLMEFSTFLNTAFEDLAKSTDHLPGPDYHHCVMLPLKWILVAQRCITNFAQRVSANPLDDLKGHQGTKEQPDFCVGLNWTALNQVGNSMLCIFEWVFLKEYSLECTLGYWHVSS